MSLTVVLAVGVDSSLIATSRSAMQSAGYVVITTQNIKDAIDQFKVGDFDLVFTDDSISPEDRTILTKLIRACGSRTPVESLASLFNHCDGFAGTPLKSEEKALLAGFGAFICELAKMEPAYLRSLRNQLPEATPANDFTRRKGPYREDHIDPAWNQRQGSIQEDLRRALERNELAVHYQPKIDLHTGSVIGAEALCRWEHPTRGLVSPTRFIPIAEQCGLMPELGQWVLRQACIQAKSWMKTGMDPIKVAVNISEVQLENRQFSRELFAILNETGLHSTDLELDISASILTRHHDLAARVLKPVQDAGVHISADNLGITQTNFNSLRTLPLNSLKIDRSSIWRLTSDHEGQATVKTIIRLGHQMNLRVVAEGVEEARHLDFLWERGCDEAQGYYFGRPVTAVYFARNPNHRETSMSVA